MHMPHGHAKLLLILVKDCKINQIYGEVIGKTKAAPEGTKIQGRYWVTMKIYNTQQDNWKGIAENLSKEWFEKSCCYSFLFVFHFTTIHRWCLSG